MIPTQFSLYHIHNLTYGCGFGHIYVETSTSLYILRIHNPKCEFIFTTSPKVKKIINKPPTERLIDPDPIASLTNSVCSGVTVTTHMYVPLSMEELGGENTNWAMNNVLFTLICGGRGTRPLTPENAASSLVHVLFTTTSLYVTPPSKVILQFRVTVTPA